MSRHFAQHMAVVTAIVAASVTALGSGDAFAQNAPKNYQVILDPDNNRNISGYVHLAVVWGEHFTPPRDYQRAMINVKDAMHRWTKVAVTIDRQSYMASLDANKLPFAIMAADQSFELSSTEKAALQSYFDDGGFLFCDNALSGVDYSQAYAAFKKMFRDVLGSQGRIQPLPDNHALYSSFFMFEGPPIGSEIKTAATSTQTLTMINPVQYLEGLWYKGRLVAVLSDKGYIVRWNDMTESEPQLKFAVNLVVYSLLRTLGLDT